MVRDQKRSGASGESAEEGAGSPLVSGAVSAAVALAGWVGTDATSGWLRIVLGLATLPALAYAVYTLGLVVGFLAVKRVIDAIVGDPLAAVRSLFVWILMPTLVASWALWAWLAGFDASQWAWTGASLGAGTLILLLVLLPRRRGSVSVASRSGSARPRGKRR